MTVSSPSRPTPYAKVLGAAESKIARALLGGQEASIAKAVLGQDNIKNAIIQQLLVILNKECTSLCKKDAISPFRIIPVDQMTSFNWKELVEELKCRAPFLFTILHSIASRNDHRNKVKTATVHYPGICSAAAIILKERNREMCGLQSIVSLLMYSCHAEKQVRMHTM